MVQHTNFFISRLINKGRTSFTKRTQNTTLIRHNRRGIRQRIHTSLISRISQRIPFSFRHNTLQSSFRRNFTLASRHTFNIGPRVSHSTINNNSSFTILRVRANKNRLLLRHSTFRLHITRLHTSFFLMFLSILLRLRFHFRGTLLRPATFTTILNRLLLSLQRLPLVFRRPVTQSVTIINRQLRITRLLLRQTSLNIRINTHTTRTNRLHINTFSIHTRATLLTNGHFTTATRRLTLAFGRRHRAQINILTRFNKRDRLLRIITFTLPAHSTNPHRAMLHLRQVSVNNNLNLIRLGRQLTLLRRLPFTRRGSTSRTIASQLRNFTFTQCRSHTLRQGTLVRQHRTHPNRRTTNASSNRGPTRSHGGSNITFETFNSMVIFRTNFIYDIRTYTNRATRFLIRN